jgi:hypothetical protein
MYSGMMTHIYLVILEGRENMDTLSDNVATVSADEIIFFVVFNSIHVNF